ncbi:MAG: hypothetical protein ACKESB_02125 [Candidatus Hodgkinia cicadicola]
MTFSFQILVFWSLALFLPKRHSNTCVSLPPLLLPFHPLSLSRASPPSAPNLAAAPLEVRKTMTFEAELRLAGMISCLDITSCWQLNAIWVGCSVV